MSEKRPKAEQRFASARDLVARHGAVAVFFSTWALAPLGPWVNLAAGAGGLKALTFTLWDALGEAIWVAFYVLIGYSFAADIVSLADVLTNTAGFLAAVAVAIVLGLILLRRFHRN
jgi:membrane protein DedA with SNARE-associated domain